MNIPEDIKAFEEEQIRKRFRKKAKDMKSYWKVRHFIRSWIDPVLLLFYPRLKR